MLLWRISNYADLIGTGGLLFPGRWHSAGRPIVYLAESPAGALVEILVHLDRDNLPDRFQLIGVETGDMTIEQAPPLIAGWENDVRLSRAAGDEWRGAGRTAALRAPSSAQDGTPSSAGSVSAITARSSSTVAQRSAPESSTVQVAREICDRTPGTVSVPAPTVSFDSPAIRGPAPPS